MKLLKYSEILIVLSFINDKSNVLISFTFPQIPQQINSASFGLPVTDYDSYA